MNEQQKTLVKATVPVLKTNEVAMAVAVAAYAENIDDPSVLLPVVERIAHKHVSLGIRAEHYAIVGRHLLSSIKEVLGDAASDELINAWAAAYTELADLFINLESDLYQQATQQEGGWTGWRPFRIGQKVQESEEITSFYLYPIDGGKVPTYKPGQYISVKLFVAKWNLFQPRQYSLSDAPGNDYLRISVKRERANAEKPDGQVSNLLHDQFAENAILDISMPLGDFFLNETVQTPVVLLSGGVGITPMVSILNHLVATQSSRKVHFIHTCRNNAVHAFKSHVEQLAAAQTNVETSFFYDQRTEQDSGIGASPLAVDQLLSPELADAEYYLCGPAPFMRHYLSELQRNGVASERIFAEAFGSGGVN